MKQSLRSTYWNKGFDGHIHNIYVKEKQLVKTSLCSVNNYVVRLFVG